MKKHLLTVFGSVVSLTLLCSAGYGEQLDYEDFTAPYGRRLTLSDTIRIQEARTSWARNTRWNAAGATWASANT